MKKLLKHSLAALALAVLAACGGGGGAPTGSIPSNSSTTVADSTTTDGALVLDGAQTGVVRLDSADAVTTLKAPANSAVAAGLKAGTPLLIPAGQDPRFPLGLSGVVESVSTDANTGETVAQLAPATLADIYSESSSTATDIPLAAENFIGAIAPLALSGGDTTPQQVGLIRKSVSAFNGALQVRPARLSGVDAFMTGLELEGDLAAGDIVLKQEIKLRDLLSEIEASKLQPYGQTGEAKFVVDLKLSDLKLTQQHEFKKVLGIPYALNSLDYKLKGRLSGELKFTGGMEAEFGSYSRAWKETESEAIKLLGVSGKLLGIESKDKIGKVPLMGLVFSVPCAAATAATGGAAAAAKCTVKPGQSQTPIREASAGGVIVWVYLNAKGEIKFEGETGVRVNMDTELGVMQPEGGTLSQVLKVGRSSGLASSANFIEAPFVKGELNAAASSGVSLDLDAFVGGVRILNTALDAGSKAEINVKADIAHAWPDIGEDWVWTGSACLQTSVGAGVIGAFRVGIGGEIKTGQDWVDNTLTGKVVYEVEKPDAAERTKVGLHKWGPLPMWYTHSGAAICLPQPVVSKIDVSRNSDGKWVWQLNGQNMPDDMELSVHLDGVCADEPELNWIAGDNGRTASFSCTAGPVSNRSFGYGISSPKASNMVLNANLTHTPEVKPVLMVNNPSPTQGEQFQLWISQAWGAVVKVVYTIQDQSATVWRAASDTAQKAFVTVAEAIQLGSHTVTAKLFDQSNALLGSTSVEVTVNGISTTITTAEDDRTTPALTIAANGTTEDTTPTLRGTLSGALGAGQTVHVYANRQGDNFDDPLGSATIDGLGWSFTPRTPLAQGTYIFEVVVAQALDGTFLSALSNAYSVEIKAQGAVATSKLPHTGITASQCYSAGSNTLMTCSGVASDLNAQQDGHRTNINPMSYSAVGSHPLTSCVKDNVTGLIWEGKEASGTRAGSNTYTNYHSAFYGTQVQMDAATNTYGYVAAVNAMALCGYTDWRLPTVDELQTIVDYSKTSPSINTTWFLNTPSYSWYWASSPYVGDSGYAWVVYFYYGYVNGGGSRGSGDFHVRLVRASQ